jgi:superoxide dismutase, Fe-Mn family
MLHTLPALPYKPDALEPYLSAETVEYHYTWHHKAHVRMLNEQVAGTRYAAMSLEEIIVRAPPGVLANNAVQAWNHDFYWRSMSPEGGGAPAAALADAIDQWFGSLDCFRQAFEKACLGLCGSGWVWLVQGRDGRLAISALRNSGTNPLSSGQRPLLACDLWEHAYYLDHRNQRTRYLRAFWDVVNWQFAAANLAQPLAAAAVPWQPAARLRRPQRALLRRPG